MNHSVRCRKGFLIKNLYAFMIKVLKKHKIKETDLDIIKPIGDEHFTL